MEREIYTVGDALKSLINVLGFNLIDSTSALPEIIAITFISFMCVVVWKKLKG